jgi:transposase InsO family protein
VSDNVPTRNRGSAAVPVGVGTRFVYDGEILTVVELFPTARGNEVLVADRGGKRRRWMSLRELMASGRATIMTTDEGPRSTDDLEIASVVLANLSGQQLAKIIETARHVREVLYGYRSGSPEMAEEGEPRPQYLPTVPLGQRYCAKADELNVDKRTVQRWVAAYLEHGEAGLSSVHQRNPLGRTDPRWINTAMEIMVDHGLRSRPNGKSILQQTRARLAVQYGDGVVPIPSQPVAYRRLEQLDRLVPTFTGSRERNRDVASRPNREYGQLIATRPGEYMVMDTNYLDVFALDPITLKWVTVELTIAMCAYTRCITGLRVTPTTKSIDVAATLYQTFRPTPAPDDWPEHAVWPEHGVPRIAAPDVDALRGNAVGVSNPAIFPDTIVVDHGRPFKSQHMTSVCERMGISIQPARLRTGRDKGIVERFFLSLRLDLLQHLPGYKGPDVYSRGIHPESDAFLYIDEIEAIIRKWVAVVYHNRPHDSLVDPAVPGHHLSPAEMFQHGVERAGYIEAPRDPDLAFEFLQPVRRQIHHYRVDYRGRRYDGPALNEFRNHDSPYPGKANRRWYIHVNPDDITRVYFRHPQNRIWHTLMWRHARVSDLPMNEDAAGYARQLAKARGTSTQPEVALEAMLDEWNLGFGKTATERRIALRLSRQRAQLVGDLATADEPEAQAFIAELLNSATGKAAVAAETGPTVADDDLDSYVDDDPADNADEMDDDTYYADAFKES